MSAQKARGADFETGNILRRAKALVPILVPLFISAFRRADELLRPWNAVVTTVARAGQNFMCCVISGGIFSAFC